MALACQTFAREDGQFIAEITSESSGSHPYPALIIVVNGGVLGHVRGAGAPTEDDAKFNVARMVLADMGLLNADGNVVESKRRVA